MTFVCFSGSKDGHSWQALVSGGAEGCLIVWRVSLSEYEPWTIVARLEARPKEIPLK